jgi:hypothetical protein
VSSHREAPQISKDPTADSTDLYAFVSPDAAGTVTLIANYIPLYTPSTLTTPATEGRTSPLSSSSPP